MKIPTIAQLEAALTARGWVIHHEPGRLNIIPLRRRDGVLDAFDDMLVVLWTDDRGHRQLWACRCTTDPGRPGREHPTRRDGTPVWAVSQMVDGFALGLHHPGTAEAYVCFRPVRPVPVLRYTSVEDTTGAPSTSNSVQIHRASKTRESTVVGAWSIGCTVVANPKDYDHLVELGHMAEAAGFPRFTVSLMEWS